MNEMMSLMIAGSLGAILGAFFFLGLWFTLRQSLSSKRPALWIIGSFLLRMGVVLEGFYLVAGNRWDLLVACLVGFIIARLAVTRFTTTPASPAKAVNNAP